MIQAASHIFTNADGYRMERTACVICGRNGSRNAFDFRPPGLKDHYSLHRCPHCGASFVNPHPTREAINRFFSDESLFVSSTDPEGRDRSMIRERERKRLEFSGYIRRLKMMQPAGRMLDVGCGLGFFLELMGPGYDRLGIDINPVAADITAEKAGCRVVKMDAMDARFDARSFDLISIMQTLDHFDLPGVMLRRTAEWLKPGGVLFLSALINAESPMARLFGPGFRLLHPFHLAYFTRRGIRRALADCGLKIAGVEYPYFKTPYFNGDTIKDFFRKTTIRLVRGKRGNRMEYSPPCIGNTMNVYAVKAGG